MSSPPRNEVEHTGLSDLDLNAEGGIVKYRLLKLRALGAKELPPHPDLSSAQDETSPSMQAFLQDILTEAKLEYLQLFTNIGTFKDQVTAGGKKIPFSVEKLKYTKPGQQETWFARRSSHEEDAEPKVKFSEWDGCVRVDHAIHEGEYDPSIFDVNCLLRWDGVQADGMKDVDISVNQMYHTMPFPLKGRLFNELVISGVRTDTPAYPPGERFTGTEEPEVIAESLIVQIPIDITTFPDSVRSKAHDNTSGGCVTYTPREGAPSKQQAQKGKKFVVGEYVAVEKISETTKATRWDMKTVSNAKGALPRSVQNLGVAGAIAKDVGFGLNWILKRRSGERTE